MDIENIAARKAASGWGVRHKLVFKAFLMCLLCYSLRFNLSIAIVAMVDETEAPSSPSDSSHSQVRHHEETCPSLVSPESLHKNESYYVYLNASDPTPYEVRALNLSRARRSKSESEITFRWNEKDQGLVLASFFWGYMVSQFPAGLLAYKYGGKWVASLGMIWTALFGVALPQAAIVGGKEFVILVRILQGFSSGFVVPSLVVLLAKWTPPEERARLSSVCFAGLPLGTALTMIVSGYLIPTLGWPSVFYIPGVLTILWFIMWTLTVHSSPEDDPSISPEELKYLQSCSSVTETENPADSHSNAPPKLSEVPWKEIATSLPIWAIFTSQFCSAWGHNMLKSEGPKYLHSALHFNIHENSYLSASPYIFQFALMLAVGRLSDFLIERKVVSMLNSRKICNTIGQWGAALFFLGIILAGCDRTTAVICYILSGMINGAMVSGAYVNIIDISPRYACTIEGVINGLANIAGFGAPYVAGLILFHESSIVGWNYVFLVPVISNVIGNLVFILGASVKVQRWNNPNHNCDKNSIEISNLNNNH